MELPFWAIILIVIYGVSVAGLFIGFTIHFFRRHPDGAADMDEGQFLGYFSLLLLVVCFWPLVLLGWFYSKYIGKHRVW